MLPYPPVLLRSLQPQVSPPLHAVWSPAGKTGSADSPVAQQTLVHTVVSVHGACQRYRVPSLLSTVLMCLTNSSETSARCSLQALSTGQIVRSPELFWHAHVTIQLALNLVVVTLCSGIWLICEVVTTSSHRVRYAPAACCPSCPRSKALCSTHLNSACSRFSIMCCLPRATGQGAC